MSATDIEKRYCGRSFSGLDVESHFEELSEEDGPITSPANFRLGEYLIEPFIRPALCCFLMSLSLIGIALFGYFALQLASQVDIKHWNYICFSIIGIGSVACLASVLWLRKAHKEGTYYRDLQKRLMIMNQPNRFETRIVKCRQSIHPSKLSFSCNL